MDRSTTEAGAPVVVERDGAVAVVTLNRPPSLVRRFKEPGSRQYVYEWRDDAWTGCLQHQLEQTAELLTLAENAQARGADLPERQRGRLREMHEYYTFMARSLEVLLGEYTASRAAGRVR